MSAPINFTQLSSATILFASKDAANAFFSAFTVPGASAITFSASDADPGTPVGVTFSIVNQDNSVSNYQVPLKTELDTTNAAVAALAAKLEELITELTDAGFIEEE